MQVDPPRDLARTTLQLLALGALIVSSFWILRPFLVALAWATTIAIATWPLLLQVQARLGGRRSLAVALMTTVLLLILFLPLYFGIMTIVGHVAEIVHWSRSLTHLTVPLPPPWVGGLPLVGAKVAARWEQIATSGQGEISTYLAPIARTIALWFVGHVGNIGLLLVQLLLTVIIVSILYANGETAARGAERFAYQISGARGENAVHLAAQAIRAVALGVVVTAILQSALSWIGLVIADVPLATILTAVIFILAVAQVGAAPVLLAAVIWVYRKNGAVWGTGFLAWAIFCATFDNFLRPLLIKRGVDIPLLLIFAGVIGGLITFGVIGLFIGPVVLAVAYTLLAEWMSENSRPDEQRTSPQAR
jgi:predicted PurR-regulated permease PerM